MDVVPAAKKPQAPVEEPLARTTEPALVDAPLATAVAPDAATTRIRCPLSSIAAGSRATVLEVQCGDMDACRLRALGICEGACVSVVRSRDCTLLEVRGARLAVGSAIAAGIVVMPLA